MTLPAILNFPTPPDRANTGDDFGVTLTSWIELMNAATASFNAYMTAVQAQLPAAIGAATPDDVAAAILAARWAAAPTGGECYLSYTSATVLTLWREKGKRLIIDDVTREVPAAGITLANPGVANTLYYIYAYWSGSAVALLYDTATPVADTRNGVMTKTGDVTRSLVGMAQTNASGQWENSTSRRLVCSYYNPKTVTVTCQAMASNLTTASTTEIATNRYVDYVTFTSGSVMITAVYFSNSLVTSNRYDLKIGSALFGSFLLVNYVANQQTLSTQVSIVPFAGYVKLDSYFYVGSGTGTLYSYSGFQIVINQ